MAVKSAMVALGDGEPADRFVDLAGVLQHGNDQAEGGSGQGHGQQEGVLDPVDGAETEPDGHRQQERQGEPDPRQPGDVSPELGQVDLEAGEEEEEGKAHESQNLDGQVDGHPAEHRRSHHDAGHDLEHDGWDTDARHQSDQERCRHRDRRHHQQSTE